MKKDIKNILLSETENVDLPMSKKLLDTPIISKDEFLKEDIVKEINVFEQSINREKAVSNKHKFSLKMALSSLCLVMVAILSVISVFAINANKASALTTYIIDINPSICITTDKKDKVVSAYSLNEDGDVLISDNSFSDIKGKSFDHCMRAIIKYLIEHNYIGFNMEKQSRRIHFQVTNNKESFAMEKCKQAREFFYNELKEKGYTDYEIYERFMPVHEFRDKMGFDKNIDDLDKMRDDIVCHHKYFDPNFIPPPPPPNCEN